jgi:hypothetical protein
MKSLLISLLILTGISARADDIVIETLKSKYVLHLNELDAVFAQLREEQRLQNGYNQNIAKTQSAVDALQEEIRVEKQYLDLISGQLQFLIASSKPLEKSCSKSELKRYVTNAEEQMVELKKVAEKNKFLDKNLIVMTNSLRSFKIDLELSQEREERATQHFNRIKEWLFDLMIQYREILSEDAPTPTTLPDFNFPTLKPKPLPVPHPGLKTLEDCLNSGKTFSECVGVRIEPADFLDPEIIKRLEEIKTPKEYLN